MVSSPVTKDYEESSGKHVEWTPVGGGAALPHTLHSLFAKLVEWEQREKPNVYTAHTWGKESQVGIPPHIHSFFRRLKPKDDTSPDTNRLATQSVL